MTATNNNHLTIFIVEDNEMFAETLKIAVENMGYSTRVFHSGEQMIFSWDEDPAMILLDYFIESPQGVAMNGNKILQFVRRISRNLPVVVLTSNTDVSQATEMLKLGAVDFIIKDEELLPNLTKTMTQVFETVRIREAMANNRMKIKKYRQRILIVVLIVALAAVTVLWITS
jgi:FixJ family two-component response regulator